MKIALITDTHFGARGDHGAFDRFFKKFYEGIFFPVLERESIQRVVHLGDIFDRRKYINYLTLNNCREYFFDRINSLGIVLDIIVGNHDVFYKNTNEINSPSLLLKEYSTINVYDDPTTVSIGGTDILYLPWITSDNYGRSIEEKNTTKATLCFGHLELAGFQMYKGFVNDHGFDSKMFERFDRVFTGHFHHRSSSGNITYLGNPYEITWSDYKDPRGFHIFDTETRELSFIENPYTIFHKIFLNKDYVQGDYSHLEDCFIKVVVQDRDQQMKLDLLIDRLEKVNPADIQVVDDHLHKDIEDNNDILESAEDTLTILSKFCEQMDDTVDKKKLDSLIRNLYNEAINLESA